MFLGTQCTVWPTGWSKLDRTIAVCKLMLRVRQLTGSNLVKDGHCANANKFTQRPSLCQCGCQAWCTCGTAFERLQAYFFRKAWCPSQFSA